MLGDALIRRPSPRIEIAVHEELPEAQEREGNLPPYGPALLQLQDVGELLKVRGWGIFVLQGRHLQPEVPAHLLDQG